MAANKTRQAAPAKQLMEIVALRVDVYQRSGPAKRDTASLVAHISPGEGPSVS